jgi:putative addiction module component (TIGR02574 family)
MANAHKLLEDALELSEEEREQLAWTLLDSLHDAHEDAGAAGDWGEEIRRRLADYRANRSEGRPWQEVDAAMRARLGGR